MEATEDPPQAVLFPEEEALLGHAVGKRRQEFTTSRVCARVALAKLGLPPTPLVHGSGGEPLWPSGVVGSITHCAGYRAAAVANTTHIVTIGIDAEPNCALPDGVLEKIAIGEELIWLREFRSTSPGVCWDRLLFSAKETVYKAWFTLARRWLGFEDAAITVDPISCTFSVRLLVPGPLWAGGPLTGFAGRWLVCAGRLLTAIALPPQPPPVRVR